jgi:RND family efflux transporter MFP subunit
MSLRRKIFLRLILPIILVGLGVGGALLIFRMAPSTARAETPRPLQVVDAVVAQPAPRASVVSATGTVVAAREVTVTPEVTGRVIERNEDLVPGGRLRAGDIVVRLDGSSYRLAIDAERARIATSESQLETERARGELAEREWAAFGDGRPSEEVPLALRRPQLRAAQANLSAAQSALTKARLDLGRTVLKAPWNAVVIEANAEVGQLAGPSSRLATLVGTDEVWVRVSVPVEQAVDLAIPGVNGEEGAPARVMHELSRRRTVEWQGRVIRLEGQLDTETRTAQLLVAVSNPFEAPEGGLPLLPGTFVNVELAGREHPEVYQLPRAAISDGSQLWVVNEEGMLDTREVVVGWGNAESVFVTEGLEPGLRVVTSPLSLPLVGEQVRLRGDGRGES